MQQTVRLTIQLRDHSNQVRMTEHVDVPLSAVKERAAEVAQRMAGYYRRERAAQKE